MHVRHGLPGFERCCRGARLHFVKAAETRLAGCHSAIIVAIDDVSRIRVLLLLPQVVDVVFGTLDLVEVDESEQRP